MADTVSVFFFLSHFASLFLSEGAFQKSPAFFFFRPRLLSYVILKMCWSLPASATFGIIAGATAVWRWRAGDIRGKVFFFGYFALMEALQCASYLVINDCASKANQIMTALAW